jgi:hypothetical protein
MRKGIAPRDIVSSAEVDGKELEPEELSFGSSGEPELEFRRVDDTLICFVSLYLGDELIASPTVASIVKGDVNMDGAVNAVDASIVLSCYARQSVGESFTFTGEENSDGVMERLAFMSADIDTESVNMCSEPDCRIDSLDASRILAYYAQRSVVSGKPQWN